jgi:hypothetical protein
VDVEMMAHPIRCMASREPDNPIPAPFASATRRPRGGFSRRAHELDAT